MYLKRAHNALYSKCPMLYHVISFVVNYWRPRTTNDLGAILSAYAKLRGEVFFVQIGSNDGISNDPLYEHIINYGWSGVLIEPIESIFEQLKFNYRKVKGLIFLNAAISDKDGTSTIYTIDESMKGVLPDWCFQLTSFKKEVLLSHKLYEPKIEHHICEKKIDTYSFNTLLKKYDIKKIDLLHIDTEGFDYEIIKQIDFVLVLPDVVIFENKHLKAEDYRNCIKLFKKLNYNLIAGEYDTICINEKFSSCLSGIKRNHFFQRKLV